MPRRDGIRRATFLNRPRLVDSLVGDGWSLYLAGIEPEYYAAKSRKCTVLRIVGIRGDVDGRMEYSRLVAEHAGLDQVVHGRRLDSGSCRAAMDEMDASLRAEERAATAEYKRHFPIWGRAPVRTVAGVDQLMAPPAAALNLRFENGAIDTAVRQALR